MSWLTITDAGWSPSGKTRKWTVHPKDSPGRLGVIKWFPNWRKYVFSPNMDAVEIVFEEDCLREIAAFCEQQTREHKKAKVTA